MTTYTAIGTSDEVLQCSCCGKAPLKMTRVLRDNDGEIHYFGSTCAARATGWSNARLAREMSNGNAKVQAAADIVKAWSRYVSAAGVDVAAFRANNPVALRNRPATDDEIRDRILDVIAENQGIVMQVQR